MDRSRTDEILDDVAWDLDLPAQPKRQRKRYIDEITELRAKVADYSEQLAALTQRQEIDIICATPWESISRRQAMERSVAEQDNARLKDAVQEQLAMIEALLRIVQKRPKLMDISYLEDWKLQRLPADPTQRRLSFNAMLDAEYDRLESVFLAQRLHDATESRTLTHVGIDDDQLVLTCTMVYSIHAAMGRVANALWATFSQEEPVALESGALLPLSSVDEATRYTKLFLRFPGDVELHGNMACKRYDESAARIAFTMRIVHNDDVYPYPPEVYVPQETGWFVVEMVDSNESRIKYFSRGHVPCKSHHDASRQRKTDDLSFAALAELVLAGYRSNIRTLQAMINQRLFEPRL
ncbi:hypothetical protein SPRG_00115 [Saprolegnia parasitica CBS 223.65]|uniref:START domain-containing protein n=1 Tax=Saprolegnia parasitica (strain CBS 223.65) TaxID=695850 RepID=A0A067CXQ9_SAPPC|nr:hypothetical protein SPRG_00115 [Saprolegnia parasitica CBS 223.65]KDO35268.1 hypothetical protein SPRG_00115 [Saprolegnia parasitica CBS 223.65]|eukprot:XP_012193618.1 hypothetical protein SPRG_00115 [Saprolegnia parasitica CBS 223.65]